MSTTFLLGAALLLGACEYRAASEAGRALKQEQKQAVTPDQVSRNVAFFIYENNRSRALVEAELMERYEHEDSTYTLLHAAAPDSAAPDSASSDSASSDSAARSGGRVTARIFESSDGEEAGGKETPGSGAASGSAGAPSDSVSAIIRADRVVYRDDERRFEARGRVVVTTAAGKRLESEHLAWLEEERRITTPDFVTITTPTDRIQGYGLRADENLDSYQLGRVTGQVTVEDTP